MKSNAETNSGQKYALWKMEVEPSIYAMSVNGEENGTYIHSSSTGSAFTMKELQGTVKMLVENPCLLHYRKNVYTLTYVLRHGVHLFDFDEFTEIDSPMKIKLKAPEHFV
ncbi:hypothetical protein [Vibrio phage phiKT1024]|nr:hypothetical protein [Vibrio phage phiKT1024]